jgi:MFS family permease
LFSPDETPYGASRLAFTFLAAALLLCAVYTVLRARSESEQRRKALMALASSCAAAAGTYLFWMIVGPYLQESDQTMRYAAPVLIGACAVALPLWTALSNRRTTMICLCLAAALVALFAVPARERLSTLYYRKTALAYVRNWSQTQSARDRDFIRLLDKDPLRVGQLQNMIPAGEPLLVWVDTPFLLDYARNKIIDMNVAGLSQPWGRIPVTRYILWQYRGYGFTSAAEFRRYIRYFGRRTGQTAARGLDVLQWLQAIAPQSKIIADQNGVMLFETDAKTLPPPDDGAVEIAAKK